MQVQANSTDSLTILSGQLSAAAATEATVGPSISALQLHAPGWHSQQHRLLGFEPPTSNAHSFPLMHASVRVCGSFQALQLKMSSSEHTIGSGLRMLVYLGGRCMLLRGIDAPCMCRL